MIILWVALGGAMGAAARYSVNVWSGRTLGTAFPWHTLAVNIIGCFAMGLMVELMALKFNVGNETRAFLTTGVLGGFTTFSTFTYGATALYEERRYTALAAHIAAKLVPGLHVPHANPACCLYFDAPLAPLRRRRRSSPSTLPRSRSPLPAPGYPIHRQRLESVRFSCALPPLLLLRSSEHGATPRYR